MTELLVGVRDGYTAAQVAAEVWKTTGEYEMPSYASGDRRNDGEALYRDFGHLIQPRQH